jgi:acetyl esterase
MDGNIYVDPEIIDALELLSTQDTPQLQTAKFDLETTREQTNKTLAILNRNPPSIALVENKTIEGAFGSRRIRIYDDNHPRTQAPGLIYFHGGGWILGDLETEDVKLRQIAKKSGVRIISYEYVLAPEHPFPAPLNDCFAAAKSVYANAEFYGLDPNRLAIGGSSAGANLALSTALKLRDENQHWLKFMLLFFGSYDMINRRPSWELFGKGYMLDADYMERLFQLYVNEKTEQRNPLASPLLADLKDLPSTYINAAGLDILRDDNRALAEKLKTAGVKILYEEVRGVPHGYTLLAREVSAAKLAIDSASQVLGEALK